MELARLVSGYQGDVLVHVVPFTDLQLAIYQNADESYAITLMRRMMMRIATGLAKKRHAQAIATGESIGQVASQTLESMLAINDVTNMPIIRPVVCMDKVEIIDLSKRLEHMKQVFFLMKIVVRFLHQRIRSLNLVWISVKNMRQNGILTRWYKIV